MALEPAKSIILRFGGPSALAGILGVHRTRVSNWMRARAKGGTGGLIPQRYHPTMLGYAGQNGIQLQASDFLPVASPAPNQAEGVSQQGQHDASSHADQRAPSDAVESGHPLAPLSESEQVQS